MEKGTGCNGPLKSSLTSDLCGFILLCALQGSLDILNKHVFAATIPQKEVKFSAEYVNLNVWCKKISQDCKVQPITILYTIVNDLG